MVDERETCFDDSKVGGGKFFFLFITLFCICLAKRVSLFCSFEGVFFPHGSLKTNNI